MRRDERMGVICFCNNNKMYNFQSSPEITFYECFCTFANRYQSNKSKSYNLVGMFNESTFNKFLKQIKGTPPKYSSDKCKKFVYKI